MDRFIQLEATCSIALSLFVGGSSLSLPLSGASFFVAFFFWEGYYEQRTGLHDQTASV